MREYLDDTDLPSGNNFFSYEEEEAEELDPGLEIPEIPAMFESFAKMLDKAKAMYPFFSSHKVCGCYDFHQYLCSSN